MIDQVVDAWRATAEVYSDEDALAAISLPIDDRGSVSGASRTVIAKRKDGPGACSRLIARVQRHWHAGDHISRIIAGWPARPR